MNDLERWHDMRASKVNARTLPEVCAHESTQRLRLIVAAWNFPEVCELQQAYEIRLWLGKYPSWYFDLWTFCFLKRTLPLWSVRRVAKWLFFESLEVENNCSVLDLFLRVIHMTTILLSLPAKPPLLINSNYTDDTFSMAMIT